MHETPLDRASIDMASDQDPMAQLRFYDRLASSELFVMLEKEAEGRAFTPEVFDVSGERFVLGFDREDRLADFAARPMPYVAMSGRALARVLADLELGLVLNAGQGSEIALPSEAITWAYADPVTGSSRIPGPPAKPVRSGGFARCTIGGTGSKARLGAWFGAKRMACLGHLRRRHPRDTFGDDRCGRGRSNGHCRRGSGSTDLFRT